MKKSLLLIPSLSLFMAKAQEVNTETFENSTPSHFTSNGQNFKDINALINNSLPEGNFGFTGYGCNSTTSDKRSIAHTETQSGPFTIKTSDAKNFAAQSYWLVTDGNGGTATIKGKLSGNTLHLPSYTGVKTKD